MRHKAKKITPYHFPSHKGAVFVRRRQSWTEQEKVLPNTRKQTKNLVIFSLILLFGNDLSV